MFGGLGTREIVIIAIVLVLLFGSRKIPDLAKSIVDAVRHLKGIFKDEDKGITTKNDDDTVVQIKRR